MPIDTARLRALLNRRYTDEATASDHGEIYSALPGLLDEIDRLRAALQEWSDLAEHNKLSTESHRRRTKEALNG